VKVIRLEPTGLAVCPFCTAVLAPLVKSYGRCSSPCDSSAVSLQAFISRARLESFSLVADSSYISQSIARVMRALFEICLKKSWCSMTFLLLQYAKVSLRTAQGRKPLGDVPLINLESVWVKPTLIQTAESVWERQYLNGKWRTEEGSRLA
jgi:hypothetical protein